MSESFNKGFRIYAISTLGIVGLAMAGAAVASFNDACADVVKNPENASSLRVLVCDIEPSKDRPYNP